MESSSNARGTRVPQNAQRYKMMNGEWLKIMPLPGNTPRLSGVRTGHDKELLSVNDGKLSKLQHILS